MTSNENANLLSFTRLSFAFEDKRLDEKIIDEVLIESSTSGFRNYMDARSSTVDSESEGLQVQILLAQIVQEPDE